MCRVRVEIILIFWRENDVTKIWLKFYFNFLVHLMVPNERMYSDTVSSRQKNNQ